MIHRLNQVPDAGNLSPAEMTQIVLIFGIPARPSCCAAVWRSRWQPSCYDAAARGSADLPVDFTKSWWSIAVSSDTMVSLGLRVRHQIFTHETQHVTAVSAAIHRISTSQTPRSRAGRRRHCVLFVALPRAMGMSRVKLQADGVPSAVVVVDPAVRSGIARTDYRARRRPYVRTRGPTARRDLPQGRFTMTESDPDRDQSQYRRQGRRRPDGTGVR